MKGVYIPILGTAIRCSPSRDINRLAVYHYLLVSRLQRGMVFSAATLVALILATDFKIDSVHVLAPLATMLSTLAVYLMNDIADIKIDRINAPHRPLASGLVKKSEAILLVSVLSIIALTAGFILNPLAAAIIGMYLIVGILYSIPKISLKDRFVIKTLTIAIGGFLTSLVGSSVIGTFDERAIAAAASFFSLIFVSSPLNDLADFAGDKKNLRRTIPIVIGPRNTTLIAVILPFAIAGVFWLTYQEWKFSLLTPIGITVVSMIAMLIISPIYRHLEDFKYVRQRHKKIVFLHYGLQFALFAGIL